MPFGNGLRLTTLSRGTFEGCGDRRGAVETRGYDESTASKGVGSGVTSASGEIAGEEIELAMLPTDRSVLRVGLDMGRGACLKEFR